MTSSNRCKANLTKSRLVSPCHQLAEESDEHQSGRFRRTLRLGNGEQSLNARPVVVAGGGVMVADADFTAKKFIADILPLLGNSAVMNAMADKSKSLGLPNAAGLLADMVERVKAGA